MQNLAGKWALVTGASSGFGKEFADLLANRRANLILVARRTDPMETLAAVIREKHGVQVIVRGLDLTHPNAAQDLKHLCDTQQIEIEILINNAGYGIYGEFLEQPIDNTLNMIQLNIAGLTQLSHLFATDMAKRGHGYILMVASVLGFQPAPGYSAYAGTKAYVLNFGQALHNELKPHGVNVTVLCPGLTATSFTEVAGGRNSPILRMLTMKNRPVAEIGIQAMFAKRAIAVAGFRNQMTVFFNRLTPRAVQSKMMQKILAG